MEQPPPLLSLPSLSTTATSSQWLPKCCRHLVCLFFRRIQNGFDVRPFPLFIAVEAMKGSQESFQPFLHDVSRPHVGQIEVAANIRHILKTSKLARVRHEESDPEGQLRQDSYCLRGAPQWIGP